MEFSTEKLKVLLGEAFDAGYQYSAELKDQILQEIIEKSRTAGREAEEYRVFKVEELRSTPVGAVFKHTTRGRCWIESKSDGTKHMVFQNGKTVSFTADAEPWDRPMRLLHKEDN